MSVAKEEKETSKTWEELCQSPVIIKKIREKNGIVLREHVLEEAFKEDDKKCQECMMCACGLSCGNEAGCRYEDVCGLGLLQSKLKEREEFFCEMAGVLTVDSTVMRKEHYKPNSTCKNCFNCFN